MNIRSSAAPGSSVSFEAGRLAVGAIVTAAVNLIIFGLGHAGGASMAVSSKEITVIPVVISSVLPFALGGLVVWLINRRTAAFRRWAAWIGLLIAVLSVLDPILLADDAATGAAVGAMHIAVGVVWFIALSTRDSRSEDPDATRRRF